MLSVALLARRAFGTRKWKPTLATGTASLRSLSSHHRRASHQDDSARMRYGRSIISGRTKIRSIVELMRWHKPTGALLTLGPALWSVGLCTPETAHLPDLKTMAIFTVGAVVARGLGCTINDILDRKYDRLAERTKLRPIACGDISVKEAIVYLGVQSTIGLGVLCLNNIEVIKLGLFSVFMIATYPLFKRFTNWPQVMLAVTINWGVIMGYAAVHGSIGLDDFLMWSPIYLGANFWTLYYDTIYAHQDRTDDIFIGVKSSAIALGSNTKSFLSCMSIGMVLSLMTAGLMTQQMFPYYMSVGAAAGMHARQIAQLDIHDKRQCWRAFDQQRYVVYMILAGIFLSVALRPLRKKPCDEDDHRPDGTSEQSCDGLSSENKLIVSKA